MHCVSVVLEQIGDHEHEKEEVSSEEPIFGEVLTGRQLYVTSMEVVSTVGLVRCRSMSKDLIPVVSLSVPNSHRQVLGIPKL